MDREGSAVSVLGGVSVPLSGGKVASSSYIFSSGNVM